MSDHPSPRDDEAARRERRRKVAEVFGDVLPETTSDERDDDAAGTDEPSRDTWLRDQVPPHH